MALARFTIRQLEVFVAVSQHLSFTGAADKVGLSAQAVSQLIAELETSLGFRLFERSTRRVSLSRAGKDYLPAAQAVLRQVRLAQSTADDVQNQAVGVVRIGAPLVLAGNALPAAIAAFGRDSPRVTVRIADVPVDNLVERIDDGELDLAVGPDRATGAGVRREPLFNSAWVLWCSPEHPLAARQFVRWPTLRRYALVAAGYDHEHSVPPMQASVPAAQRITPAEVVDNITTAMGLVAQGHVATLAPAYVGVLAGQLGLVHRRVRNPETVRKVCLYQATRRPLSPAAAAFSDHLRHWLPGWAKSVTPR